MKGALDAFVKSKLTAAIDQQPSPQVTTDAPPAAPTAEPTPSVEGEGLQAAEKAASAPEEPAAPIDVAPDPQLNLDPKVVKSVSPRVRAVLKMLVDPATNLPIGAGLRKEIVDNFFVGKTVRDAGIPVAALRDYLAVAPTPDVLQNVAENASQHARMLEDYAQNPSVFAEQLYATNKDAFQNLVSSLTDPEWLQTTFPKSFASIAKDGTRNYLENALVDAQRSGDADLEAAVGKLMEWGGLASPPQAQATPPAPPNPLEERVNELEAERAQILNERQGAFINAAYQRAARTVAERISGLVTEAATDSAFTEKAQQRIQADIGQRLYNAVTANQHIIRTLDGMIRSGSGDAAHLERVAAYLQSQALALLPSVSRDVIEEYADLVAPAITQRQQKVEKTIQQRSLVGGGKPTAPAAPAFNPKQFGTTRDAFDAFVKARLSG